MNTRSKLKEQLARERATNEAARRITPWTPEAIEDLRAKMRNPALAEDFAALLARSRLKVTQMLQLRPNDPNTNDAWRDLAMMERLMRETGLLPPLEAQFDRGMN